MTFKPSKSFTSWKCFILVVTVTCILHQLDYIKLSCLFQWTTAGLIGLMAAKLLFDTFDRYNNLKIFERNNIPSVGPRDLFSGNLFDVILRRENSHIMRRYHEVLGNSYGLFYGRDPWVITTDLKLLKKIFIEDVNIQATLLNLPFTMELNTSLAQVMGDDWHNARRVLNPSFSQKQMKSDNVYSDVREVCLLVLDCLAGHKVVSGCRTVDILHNCQRFAVQSIFKLAYGMDDLVDMTPEGRDRFIDMLDDASRDIQNPAVWASIMFKNLAGVFGLFAPYTKIGGYTRLIHEILDGGLSRRRKFKHNITHNERKMIDTLMELIETKKMDEKTFRCNLFFFFIAGYDTTANTATALFWELAKNRRVQDKLRESVVASGHESEYLGWCIKETLRLYPPVPLPVGRILDSDIAIDNLQLKKGMTVIANIYSIHRSRLYWGPDADEFRPERFAEPLKDSLQFFAFAHGPRYCIGSKLAMIELSIFAAHLLLKYRLEPTDSTPEKLSISSQNMIHTIIDGPVDLKLLDLSSL